MTQSILDKSESQSKKVFTNWCFALRYYLYNEYLIEYISRNFID